MNYRIDISSVAESDADRAFLQLSQRTSPEYAKQWYGGLVKAIASLSKMPKRYALARENSQICRFAILTC
jgi:plasmid stabilization system protein ParE